MLVGWIMHQYPIPLGTPVVRALHMGFYWAAHPPIRRSLTLLAFQLFCAMEEAKAVETRLHLQQGEWDFILEWKTWSFFYWGSWEILYETLKNDPSHQNSPVSNIEDLGALDLSEQCCCNARNGINFKISVHARISFFRCLSSYCDLCFIHV